MAKPEKQPEIKQLDVDEVGPSVDKPAAPISIMGNPTLLQINASSAGIANARRLRRQAAHKQIAAVVDRELNKQQA